MSDFVKTTAGAVGEKAILTNGLTLVTGGTGIADLTLAAPSPGYEATIRIASLSSGDVVVTCATGITLNGTATIATFNAAEDTLVLVYNTAKNWAVKTNISVVLS